MSFRPFALSIITLATVCAICAAQTPKPQWTRQELQTIDRIAQAYYASETRSELEMLSRLVGRLSSVKVESLNRELATRKLPDAPTLLVEARLEYVEQGLSKQLPKPSPRETILLLQNLDQRVTQTLEAKSDADALDALSNTSSLEDWTRRLWKLHVLENQLESAQRMADSMAQLAKGYPTGLAIKLNADERSLIQGDYRQLAETLRNAKRDVEEREIELRIGRLERALNRLEDPALDTERFFAAYTSEVDSQIIGDFWQSIKRGERHTENEQLSATEVIESVESQIRRARELGRPLSYKAALLYDGLHWWLRGRYGMGPEAAGLAKSAEAMVSPVAQFGLYMPTEVPQPTDPADPRVKQAIPAFDRRHHYWWAWEDRRLQRGKQGGTTSRKEENFNVMMSAFW
jgi:hypothetical protein